MCLNKVEAQIQVSTAATINASANDTNKIEYFQKTVNEIYLSKVAQNIPLSSSDSSMCDYISLQSYFLTGEAIYHAAAMIGKEIHPDYVTMRKAHNAPDENKASSPAEIKIFPNPANESLHISGLQKETAEIKIYDMQGRTLLQKNEITDNSEIEVKHLANGIYRLNVKTNLTNFKEVMFSVLR